MAKKWFIAKVGKSPAHRKDKATKIVFVAKLPWMHQTCTDRTYARSWDKQYKAERALDYRMQQMGWRVVFEDELAVLQEEVDRMEIQKALLR